MLDNQELKNIIGLRAGIACALAALTMTSGCQMLQRGDASEQAAESAPVVDSAPMSAPAAPESAVDAALAREASGASSEPVETANLGSAVVNASAPKSYTVKRGDTLWDISALYLRDPWLWPEIWHVNPAVRNPHLIYPGDVLTLAYGANGEPQMRLTRGDALRVSPLVRSTPIDGPIATIPYDAIKAFLGRPGILSKDDLRNAPRVAALRDRHMVAGNGHEIYVKGLTDTGAGRYSVIRAGEPLKDPETGKLLGYIGVFAATANVETAADISKAVLSESARETQAGDLLFADEMQRLSADILPHAPPKGVSGQIMAVVDGVSLIGQYQVVAINRGTRQGLDAGHVLAIDQRGEIVKDAACQKSSLSWCIGKNIQLPDERAGALLVFKTYENMSYGLIVSTTVPVRVADRVRAP
jgi:LysM repeat protein